MEKFIPERKLDLLLEKSRIERELKGIAVKKNGKYKVNFPDLGSSAEDNAIEVDNYEKMLSLKKDLEKLQKEINIALSKIEKGKYGICEKCHQPIHRNRLRAFPEARLCISCANK